MAFDGPSFVRHVAERLIHEFKFSAGAGTPGLVGAAKEHPARVQLEKLMPGGVEVGSGIVVDSYGGVSKQQDIVIYESLCPVFTHNDAVEATFYPVEGVIAVGEVKSGLGKAELIDAVAKSVSVKALRRCALASDNGLGDIVVNYRNYGNGNVFSAVSKDQFNQNTNSLDQVYTFVLCERFQSSAKATLENFAEECRARGAQLVPNLIASLNDGSIYPYNPVSNSVARAMFEVSSAMFSADSFQGFAQLIKMLRMYVVSGRTVDRQMYERYFLPGGVSPGLTINDVVSF
jgi:hypothetical protein